jgi:hypothetical protein
LKSLDCLETDLFVNEVDINDQVKLAYAVRYILPSRVTLDDGGEYRAAYGHVHAGICADATAEAAGLAQRFFLGSPGG